VNIRIDPVLVLPLAVLLGCPLPAEQVTCEEEDACGTTQPAAVTGDGPPTTSAGVQTMTGASADAGSTLPDAETGAESTTGQPAEPPEIVTVAVIPKFIDKNGLIEVAIMAEHADGVRMAIDTGEPIELTPIGPGELGGQIPAFTGLDNGEHTVIFTPWRNTLVGESVAANYVIALPPPGYEVSWQTTDIEGHVAAIDVLPDGRPVELGTYEEMGEPHCYLQLREETGEPVEFFPLLPLAHCTAIDLKIDRDTGLMHVLLRRKSGDGLRWWAGEIPGWGAGPKNIGIGEVGDTALALASRPGLVAVCGAKPVATPEGLDGLVVLLRPNQPAEERLFDYVPAVHDHKFKETIRDCTFTGDTLVLVGEASGVHGGEDQERERLTLLEHNVVADTEVWTVAGPGPGLQSRALAVDADDEGRYHLAGYTCLDACAPEGEVRVYEHGGKLVDQIPLGPLGSDWSGPHDIAWSPAGYAVVALGEQQGQSFVFKVQAFAPGVPGPLWTFTPNDKQALQIAFAVAVGPFGEIYAGGVGPTFAVIGG
jgi:hypothetical protein